MSDDPRRGQALERKRAKGDQVVLGPFGRRFGEGIIVGRIVEERTSIHVQVIVRQCFELLCHDKPMVMRIVLGKDRLDVLERRHGRVAEFDERQFPTNYRTGGSILNWTNEPVPPSHPRSVRSWDTISPTSLRITLPPPACDQELLCQFCPICWPCEK